MTEEKQDYITEAMELLLGPSLEIEAPRKVTERRNGELIEAERSAFVKIYTSFKRELKDIEGNDLKVWIYLALSINRYTKDARPGLRKIAVDTGMAVNTVQACLERLDKKNLLDVQKTDGKGNIYHPSDYVTVSKTDTVTVSKTDVGVSKNKPTVSAPRRDSAQLEELEELDSIYTPDPVFTALENLQGGLNSNTPKFVDIWRETHSDEWILKAVAITKEKGAGIGYADTILIGWSARGYPKTRDQKIQELKRNSSPSPAQALSNDTFMADMEAKKEKFRKLAEAK